MQLIIDLDDPRFCNIARVAKLIANEQKINLKTISRKRFMYIASRLWDACDVFSTCSFVYVLQILGINGDYVSKVYQPRDFTNGESYKDYLLNYMWRMLLEARKYANEN